MMPASACHSRQVPDFLAIFTPGTPLKPFTNLCRISGSEKISRISALNRSLTSVPCAIIRKNRAVWYAVAPWLMLFNGSRFQ